MAFGQLDVARCSRLIHEGFEGYNRQFRRITDRARRRFEQRDWKGQIQDIGERVELYDKWCLKVQLQLRRELEGGIDRRDCWRQVRGHYGSRIENVPDAGFMKTFFNSISRRTFGTVGTDGMLEFIQPAPDEGLESLAMRRYPCWDDIETSLRRILKGFKFREPYQDAARDARFMTAEVLGFTRRLGIGAGGFRRFEVIDSHFFQGARAYLVGRIIHECRQLPIVVAFENTGRGIRVDAVLLEESQVGNVFSYTRSYYFTDPTSVVGAVQFLHSILPNKPIDELYTVLGRLRQGKTERFRCFSDHLLRSRDSFVHADGDAGLVMYVFTLQSFNLVFKVIRDQRAGPTRSDTALARLRHCEHRRTRRGVAAPAASNFPHRRRIGRGSGPDGKMPKPLFPLRRLGQQRIQSTEHLFTLAERDVESHLRRPRRVGAEYGPWCKQHVAPGRGLGQRDGVRDSGDIHPCKQSVTVVSRESQADGFQTTQRLVARLTETGEQFRAVFSIVSLNEDFVHQPFAELRRHRLGQHLQLDQIMNEIPMSGQKANP